MLALTERSADRSDAPISRPEHGQRACGKQVGNPADVVRVMMGDQNGLELETESREALSNDPGIAGVNHDSLAAVPDEPDIVIVESRKRDNLNAGVFGMSSRHV